jgi:AcrR family transcriptional regulator
MNALTFAPETVDPVLDTAKRRQIVDGAREIFLSHGFEGASMNDIARAAGVSKGTLYVYFESKERLFAAIVEEERYAHVNMIFDFDHADGDVEAVLTRVATQLSGFLTQPRIVSAMRAVMGIAERMPEMGTRFYESGPCFARGKLAAYFDLHVKSGHLDIPDTMLAAAQFLELSHGPLVKPMFFGAAGPPTSERIDYVVRSAVSMFMAAYGRKTG